MLRSSQSKVHQNDLFPYGERVIKTNLYAYGNKTATLACHDLKTAVFFSQRTKNTFGISLKIGSIDLNDKIWAVKDLKSRYYFDHGNSLATPIK